MIINKKTSFKEKSNMGTYETVTPDIAKSWLVANRVNRRLDQGTVRQYASDMENGMWFSRTGESIKFSEGGDLIDGQHRLHAVIKSGKPIVMEVTRGIERDAIHVIDTGRPRSALDSMQIDEIDKTIANADTIAMARLHAFTHYRIKKLSVAEIRKIIETFKDSFIFAANECKKYSGKSVNTRTTPLMLALAYAYECGESEDRLQNFVEVYSSGRYERDKDTAAIQMREDSIAGNTPIRGTVDREKTMFKFEKAIYDFCNETPRSRTYKNWDTPIYSCNRGVKK